MIPYAIDFDALIKEIRKRGFKDVLIQLPEGMQIYALEIAEKLNEFNVFISADPCYGACDVEIHEGMLTIQFGHSEIPNINYPENVIFVEAFANVSFEDVVKKFLSMVDCKKIGITASIQHIKEVENVKKFIELDSREAFVGDGDGRVKYPGQVLGCNFSTARNIRDLVDCFVFLGTGIFHALGISVVTKKNVFVLDPYSGTVEKVTGDRFLKQRYAALSQAMNASKFGIIVSSKIGQRRGRLALELKRIVEGEGKKAYLIMTGNIVPENMYYEVDVFVNTACPRITYDDYQRFRKLVITPNELMIALGKKRSEELSFDEIVEVD